MPKAFGFGRGYQCPRCKKWARISTTISFQNKIKVIIAVISCKYCGFRKVFKAIKEK